MTIYIDSDFKAHVNNSVGCTAADSANSGAGAGGSGIAMMRNAR